MLNDLKRAKLKELEEAYLIARYRGLDAEAAFWNRELIETLLGVLNDSGNPETASGADS
jgi:hypothetical protein